MAVINNCRRSPCYDQRCEVLLSKGSLSVRNETASSLAITRAPAQGMDGCVEGDRVLGWGERYADAFAAEMRHFASVVAGVEQAQVCGDDGAAALALALDARRSLQEGAVVVCGQRATAPVVPAAAAAAAAPAVPAPLVPPPVAPTMLVPPPPPGPPAAVAAPAETPGAVERRRKRKASDRRAAFNSEPDLVDKRMCVVGEDGRLVSAGNQSVVHAPTRISDDARPCILCAEVVMGGKRVKDGNKTAGKLISAVKGRKTRLGCSVCNEPLCRDAPGGSKAGPSCFEKWHTVRELESPAHYRSGP